MKSVLFFLFLLSFFLLSVESSKASTSSPITTITSNLTIDQNWVNTHLGPWFISGSSITVTFGENLTISNSIQYFEITGSNVIINGDNHIVTIDGIANFNGLVDAQNPNASSAEIKNIGVETTHGTTLNGYAGYISANNNKAIINLCYSTGIISGGFSGGIVGANNDGIVKNCHSSGEISGETAGGIAGIHNNSIIENCYSTGKISGNSSGGISTYYHNGLIKNCYSTGEIAGDYCGGIFGSPEGNHKEISNCYSTGQITGTNSAGIVVNNKPTGKISNCYATGQITEINSAGIYSSNDDGLIINTLHTSSGWNNTYANSVLIGVGKIWDNTVSPYQLTLITTLPSIVLASPIGTLTSCLNSSSTNHITFVVTGADLTESVTITAPSNFEISTNSNGIYSSSLTLTNISTVSETLYVRLNSLATAGSKSGTITATSTDASDATTTVSGTVYELPSITISGTTTNPELVSLTAIAIEGSTYAWSDGSSLRTASNTFDASGLYSLVVSDINSCTSSTLLNIKVQHWGLSSSGAKTLDSAIQINSSGQIGSLNPLTQDGKKSEYKVRIIRDGLVLNLDAGNSSSYPGTGSTWTDLSGNNNHGTLENGPTYSSANGGSIVFDGVNDRVSAFPTQISGTGSKTISLWIKINTTSRTGLAGTRSLSEWGWGFTVNRNGTGTLAFYDTRGSDLNVAAGLGTNIWYNVSVTYDNSRIVTLYVNGLQVGISSTPFAALNASTFNGVIGNEDEYESFTHPFKGNIAQVAIYNRALTANEVLNNYNALKSRFGL